MLAYNNDFLQMSIDMHETFTMLNILDQIKYDEDAELYIYRNELYAYYNWLFNLATIQETGKDLRGNTPVTAALLRNIKAFEKTHFSEQFPFNFPDTITSLYYRFELQRAIKKCSNSFTVAFKKEWFGTISSEPVIIDLDPENI